MLLWREQRRILEMFQRLQLISGCWCMGADGAILNERWLSKQSEIHCKNWNSSQIHLREI